MSPLFRKSVLALFALTFLVAAPLVILLTAGYRYSWKKNRFEKTGMIYVETEPRSVRVYLNGVPQKKTTPTSLTHLLPDDYRVRLEKTGYLNWEKTMTVESGATSFAKVARLFPNTPPKPLRTENGTIVMADINGQTGQAAVLVSTPDWWELKIFSPAESDSLPLARFPVGNLTEAALTWSPDSRHLLLKMMATDGPRAFVYAADDPGRAVAIHELAAAAEKNLAIKELDASWNNDGSLLAVRTKRSAYVLRPDNGPLERLPFTGILNDVRLGSDAAYVLTTIPAGLKDATADRTSIADDNPVETVALVAVRLTDGRNLPMAELPAGAYRLIDVSDRFISVGNRLTGQLLLIDPNDGQTVVKTAAGRLRWENGPGRGRLLLWNDFEINVFDPSDRSLELVTRLGTTVGDCRWLPGGQHILVSTPETVTVYELEDRNGRQSTELFRFSSVASFDVNPAGTQLYFVGAAGRQRGLYARGL